MIKHDLTKQTETEPKASVTDQRNKNTQNANIKATNRISYLEEEKKDINELNGLTPEDVYQMKK
jgi:hypothetical protein